MAGSSWPWCEPNTACHDCHGRMVVASVAEQLRPVVRSGRAKAGQGWWNLLGQLCRSSWVTVSHKSSYWRCESAPWQGSTSNDRPWEETTQATPAHLSLLPSRQPSSQSPVLFSGLSLGTATASWTVNGDACPPGMHRLGRLVVSLDKCKCTVSGVVPGWPRVRFPLFPSRLRAVRHFSLARHAGPAAVGTQDQAFLDGPWQRWTRKLSHTV